MYTLLPLAVFHLGISPHQDMKGFIILAAAVLFVFVDGFFFLLTLGLFGGSWEPTGPRAPLPIPLIALSPPPTSHPLPWRLEPAMQPL